MLTDPESLLAGFCAAAGKAGIEGWPCPVRFETLPAPHHRPSHPPNEAAVYAFTLSAAAGHSAPCGPGTVLMVAKARANKQQWSQHAHYDGTGNPSTLAGTLLAHRILWPWLGISHLDEATVAEWMLTSLDQTHSASSSIGLSRRSPVPGLRAAAQQGERAAAEGLGSAPVVMPEP